MGTTEHLETGSKPAPGELAVVQAFVNTVNMESGVDKLATPKSLASWLVRRGLTGSKAVVSDEEHRRALDFREALRAVLEAHSGGELGEKDLKAIAVVAEETPLVVRADRGGTLTLEPSGSGVSEALGRLLAIAVGATVAGTWGRLKACKSGDCRWAFYDSSKNRSGVWCDMAVCGSREKARKYRRRQSGRARE